MDRPVQWEVSLLQVENGFLVRVGCKNFVFPTYKKLEKELEALFSRKKTLLNDRYNDLKQEAECDRGPQSPVTGIGSSIRTLR